MKHHHHIHKRLLLLGLLLMTGTMVVATQFAVSRVGYDFTVVHPSNADIRLIGSDNASDDVRLLRVVGANDTHVVLRLEFGNYSMGQENYYSSAFAIVNEENYPVNITFINVLSTNWTCMHIWLHGDRDKNANTTTSDNTSVLMFANGTISHPGNTSAWTLAPGDRNASTMCSNVTDRANHTIPTPWDPTAHVRYSRNDTNASSNTSDYVWVQVEINVPDWIDALNEHSGTLYIHFEADRF